MGIFTENLRMKAKPKDELDERSETVGCMGYLKRQLCSFSEKPGNCRSALSAGKNPSLLCCAQQIGVSPAQFERCDREND